MAEPQKNPESRIQEQRTIEAAKNNIMGLNGKLGCIAKNLGDPIIAEYSGGQYFSSNDMPDYLNLDQDEQEQIRSVHFTMGGHTLDEPGDVDPTWSRKPNKEYCNTEHLGWFFDGLGRGIHLEIKCISEEGKIIALNKCFEKLIKNIKKKDLNVVDLNSDINGRALNFNQNLPIHADKRRSYFNQSYEGL